jgi:hypothetical protein
MMMPTPSSDEASGTPRGAVDAFQSSSSEPLLLFFLHLQPRGEPWWGSMVIGAAGGIDSFAAQFFAHCSSASLMLVLCCGTYFLKASLATYVVEGLRISVP